MHEQDKFSEALYDLRERYTERFGPIHPIVSLLEPELLFVILEMAMEDQVEIDTASVERALKEVNNRVALFKELSR
jgi:hypothetical protein